VQWLLNGRLQGSSEADAAIAISLPQAGDYRITALARDGAFATIALRVVGPSS
jgi:penicillin-binding protein 1C